MRVPSSGQPTLTSLPGHPVILTRPSQALERGLKVFADLLFRRLLGRAFIHPQLGRDHNLITDGLQGFADENLIVSGAVAFSRVEVCAAEFDGVADEPNGFFSIRGRTVTVAEAHASEANCGNLDIPEQTCLHGLPFLSGLCGFSLDRGHSTRLGLWTRKSGNCGDDGRSSGIKTPG